MDSNPTKLGASSEPPTPPLTTSSEGIHLDQPPRDAPQRDHPGGEGEALPPEPLAQPSRMMTTETAVSRPAQPTLRPFSEIAVRPEGQRYGDADLQPTGLRAMPGTTDGGSGLVGGGPGGGMLMGDEYFRGARAGSGTAPGQNPADLFARYDPVMPGQARSTGAGFGRAPQRAPLFPGEPDDDHLAPLQGGPRDPFGGPGGGQFGPGPNRGYGFGGNSGGGFGPW